MEDMFGDIFSHGLHFKGIHERKDIHSWIKEGFREKNKFKFLRFAQSLKVLFPLPSMKCLGLFYGKSLQGPAVLLPGKGPYLCRIARPLEPPVVKPFIQKHKTRLVKM